MRAPPTRTIERANNRSHKIRKRNVGKKRERELRRPSDDAADSWWMVAIARQVERESIFDWFTREEVVSAETTIASLYFALPRLIADENRDIFLLVGPRTRRIYQQPHVCVCVCVCVYVIHGRSSWLPFHYPRGIYRSDDEWQIQCCDTIAGVSSPVLFGFFTVDVRSDGPNVWQTRNFAAARHVRLQISSQSVHKRLKQYIWWDMKSGGRWSY